MSSLLKIHARYRLFSTAALLGLLWSLSACGYKGELRHPESSYQAGAETARPGALQHR